MGALGQVLAELERKPATAEVVDPRSGRKVGVAVSAFDVRLAVAGMLRGPSSFAALPELVYHMRRGDFSAVARSVGRRRVGPVGSAMSYAMDCASGSTPARLEVELFLIFDQLDGEPLAIGDGGWCATRWCSLTTPCSRSSAGDAGRRTETAPPSWRFSASTAWRRTTPSTTFPVSRRWPGHGSP